MPGKRERGRGGVSTCEARRLGEKRNSGELGSVFTIPVMQAQYWQRGREPASNWVKCPHFRHSKNCVGLKRAA